MAPVAGRRLEGKRVIVVGSGQQPGVSLGIGRATALLFAEHGARLLLVDKDGETAEATRVIIASGGGEASVHVADITVEDDCRSIAEGAVDELGGVDVLFNSVGIHGRGTAAEVSVELWDEVLDTNLKGVWLVARSILPLMVAQSGGSIISISSIGALRGMAVPYGVSKAGINRLTVAIAAAYAEHDIRANAIMPGLIDTPMAIEGALNAVGLTRNEYVAQREATVPMAYKGSATDVAYAALFFASDESRYVSGTCLAVDGARSAL